MSATMEQLEARTLCSNDAIILADKGILNSAIAQVRFDLREARAEKKILNAEIAAIQKNYNLIIKMDLRTISRDRRASETQLNADYLQLKKDEQSRSDALGTARNADAKKIQMLATTINTDRATVRVAAAQLKQDRRIHA